MGNIFKRMLFRKHICQILWLLCVFMCSQPLFAQGREIKGRVVDKAGEPVIGANVIEKGTANGITTNADGDFSLTVPEGATLQVSYLGYVTREIAVGNKTSLQIVLQENLQDLSEVVVVGYGTQKQGNLTAAISTIRSQEIQTVSATSVAQKLQGKVPGLNIRQNTGEPGQYDIAINIRGFGGPLYVIDGIQKPASAFHRISAADIESISVLKDASAAIYGLNAANGVVIVTTKQGTKGKTNFQFSSNFGFSTPTEMPRMCNAYEYLTLRNEANLNFGLSEFISKEELAKWKEGGPGYESTDWYGATFNDYSLRQEYNLSAEGGTDKVSYYFDLNGTFDNGMLKSNDLKYRRLNFRSNITAQLTNRIKAKVNVSIMNDQYDAPQVGIFEIFRGVISQLPTKPVYTNNNPLYLNRVQDGQAMNPVALSSSDVVGYQKVNHNLYNTSLELSYDTPLEGLVLKATGSYDKGYDMGKNVGKNYALYDYDGTADTYRPFKFQDPAFIVNNYANIWYLMLRAQADYKKSINKEHNISAMLVAESREMAERHAGIRKYYDFYTNDQIDYAGETNAASSGNESQARNLSYIGRLNYDYKGRYLIEIAGRYDGSYRYHPDVRWGFFPIVSGGWRISDEHFMHSLSPVLSNLKLRASYGKIGEDAGNPFQYIPGFSNGGGWWEFTDGKTTLGLKTPAIVNEKLTWMNSVLTDIGVDFGFFRDKLSFTFDVYQKNRSGLLAYRNVSLPNTYGGTFPQENLNKDRVRGFDLSFDYKNTVGDLYYKISGNLNYARSLAVYIEQGKFGNSFSNYRSNGVDRYQGIVWNYHVAGRYQSVEDVLNGPIQNGILGNRYVLPGDFYYEDVNGDNIIDGNDVLARFYDTNPKMNYGLTFSASYKGFDASLLFQGAALFSLRVTDNYTTMFWNEANLPAYFLDRWHREDPYDPNSKWIAGEWPAMRIKDYEGLMYQDNDVWRNNCSYLRLKNIEVGYTIPQKLVQKIGLDKVRFFFDATNVYTWANDYVKMFDPEKVASSAGGTLDAGWNYPLMQTFNFGVDIHF